MGSYYQMSDSMRGPWRTPPNYRLDGKYFYAAKTASDGSRRFAFGWIPIRQGEWDTGYIEWSGDLAIPHEFIKQPDGTLAFRCPPEILQGFKKPISITLDNQLGKWDKNEKSIEGQRLDGLGYTLIPVDADEFLFETSITLGQDTPAAGIILKTDIDLAEGYSIRFDTSFQRVVIDQWTLRVNTPQEALGSKGLSTRTDPYPLVEQPLQISPLKAIDCKVFISDSTVQVFVEERVVLSYRIYKSSGFPLGLYVEAGSVRFDNVRLVTT
jgi:beta-fructofuranosidase